MLKYTYFSLPCPSTASNTQLVWISRDWCRPCYGNTSGCYEGTSARPCWVSLSFGPLVIISVTLN